jgi:hypothetical protein
VIALGTGLPAEARDPSLPTAIEQALIGRACGARQDSETLEPDHLKCLSTQLVALRADFGRDLSRLSASSRSKVDSICSRLGIERRESYLDCLSTQLVAIRNRSNPVTASVSEKVTLPASVVSAGVASLPPLASQMSSWLSVPVIGGSLVTMLVLSGVVHLAAKARRARPSCRGCGAAAPDPGALCQACRHGAAEALRRAAAERATQLARDEEQRGQKRHEEERRRLKALQDEREQLRKQEEARLLGLQEAARRRDEDARRLQAAKDNLQLRQFTVASGMGKDALDPYVVLGVPCDSSLEAIRSAYQEANLKYNMDQVAHLSDELQQHFKAKVQAVERAYQMLEERRL